MKLSGLFLFFIVLQHHNEYIWDNLSADAEPHVFNVAAKAYRRMAETGKDQVIILSGESGAGKTENTKYMVNHMVHMCQGEQMELHDKIIKVWRHSGSSDIQWVYLVVKH